MFGDKLRVARKSKNYTLEELSILMKSKFPESGINKGTLSKYENGQQEPMISTVKKLADILEVSSDYLLEKNDNIQCYDENDNRLPLSDDVIEILDTLRTRPEMKILFSVSKKATKEDIEKTVKIIEALRK